MNVKQYQNLVGYFLLLVGVLGFFIFGPTSRDSLFSGDLFFNVTESWAWIITGLVVIGLSYLVPASKQKWTVLGLAAVLSFVGTYSFFLEDLLGASLQKPGDTILYLVLALIGYIVVLLSKPAKPKKAKI